MIEGLENLMEIHDEVEKIVRKKDFVALNEYISKFIPSDSDIAEQRTLLVATKAFRDRPETKDNRKKVLESLEKKIGPIA